MPHPGIDAILAAKLVAGRDTFHRQLFDVLLNSPWQRQDLDGEAIAAPQLLPLLARWVAEAPVRDSTGILRLLAVRRALRALVEAAGTPFAAFAADVLGLDASALADPRRLPDWKQAKLAALADPALLAPAALASWAEGAPMLAHLAAICALDSCPLDTARGAAAGAIGRWLVAAGPVPMPLHFMGQMQSSAFNVSYLADPGRHAFKRAIVRQAAHMLGAAAPAAAPSGERAGGPRRLTIVAEMVYPQHAMFRCYAELLQGLMAHHEVTLVAEAPSRCPEHALFSHRQAYIAPEERDPARLAAVVTATQPDIVLYPSVGMAYWTFALSLQRLAPLQLMSIGHPAPSCSDAIDGTLVYSGLALAPDPEYGPLFAYDRQVVPAPPPGGWHADAALDKPIDAGLLVSINAAAMKLSPPFLEALRELVRTAPAGTRLQFFPNMGGAGLLALRRTLLAMFPDALVQPVAPYPDYMANLARSAVVLQSFPFGGTNTTMDALALGIPVVCLDSGDMAGAADPAILSAAGLGDACVATVQEFVALARDLLESAPRREAFRAGARAALARGAAWEPAGTRTLADAVAAAWEARAPR